jgi:uncharacterized protein YbaA (DUF1428 family)
MYVDGFVIPVPRANKQAYREMATRAAAVFREHGAVQLVEAWGDDVPPGVVTSFPMAVKAADDEVVVFAWIAWPSREARDAGNAKVMADPRMQMEMKEAPFDAKRMIFGGFEAIVEA